MTDQALFDDRRSLGRHGWTGMLAIFGLLGGLGFWASTVEIAGAVMAPGSVVVESYPKQIQHKDGGTIAEIFVRNGDAVTAGQVLVRLDPTDIAASLSVLEGKWREAMVRESRLVAEIEGRDAIDFPDALTAEVGDDRLQTLMAVEQQVYTARKAIQTGRAAQLDEQIRQFGTQISGNLEQQTAIDQQLAILDEEVSNLEALRSDGLVEDSRVTALTKARAQLAGERGQVIATIAGVRASISERRLQLAQLSDDFMSEALEQLQRERATIAEAEEQIRAVRGQLDRTYIRAPQDGIVHELILHTVGGVVTPGQTVMQIVPQNDNLLVSVRLSPMDVDRVSAGQEARLRLSSLDQRETPELNAVVTSVAPDVTEDPNSGLQFYLARIMIPQAELARLDHAALLVPGMPVEAFVQTDARTVLSYLLQPFIDQLSRAMRES